MDFEELVTRHSLGAGILYPAVALAGEVGEVCNNLKKVIMVRLLPNRSDAFVTGTNDFISGPPPLIGEPELKERIIDELGDALFYLTKLAIDNGVTIDQLMFNQLQKLEEQSATYQRIFLK